MLLLAGCASSRADAPEARQGVVELDQRAIGFEVPGRVRAVAVKRGDVVEPGTILATLDDGLEKPVRDARAAELLAAEAQLDLLRAGARSEDVRATQAQLTGAREAEAVARRNLDRVRSLADAGVATAQSLDELSAQVARAEAERQVLEQRLRMQRAGARREELAAAEAKVAAGKAVLAAEEERLSRFVLRAVERATVLDRHLEAGEVTSPGAPALTIADVTHPYVDVFVPEGALEGIRVGTRAQVRADGASHPFAGRVEDVARRTEFTPRFLFSERERPNLVVRVRVRVDDPQQALHAGVPAFVTLEPGSAPPAEIAR